MQITVCKIAALLGEAKEAHTRYEEKFRMEGATPPEHRWEAWYARFIFTRLKEEEMAETFNGSGAACPTGFCGIRPSDASASEPNSPDPL